MKRWLGFAAMFACLCLAAAGTARAQVADGPGLRLGVGTDITGGLAYGAEVNYLKGLGPNGVELGLAFFGGSFEEETDEGIHTYREKTDIIVAAALVNYLYLYSRERPGPYFVTGIGVGAVSVEWEERSATDVSLGTPLPGGGSMQTADGTSAGTILNVGIGHRFSERIDVRAQVPTFFVTSAPGKASTVIPTFTVTAGVRF